MFFVLIDSGRIVEDEKVEYTAYSNTVINNEFNHYHWN